MCQSFYESGRVFMLVYTMLKQAFNQHHVLYGLMPWYLVGYVMVLCLFWCFVKSWAKGVIVAYLLGVYCCLVVTMPLYYVIDSPRLPSGLRLTP